MGSKLKIALMLSFVGLSMGGVGFFIGMEYKAYQVRTALQDAANKISENISTNSQSESQPSNNNGQNMTYEDKTIVDKIAKEEVILTTIKFKINNSSEKQTLSGGYGSPAVAGKGTKFVVMDMTVTNLTDAPFVFMLDDGCRFIDNQDRQFKTYQDITKVKNYLLFQELSPNVPKSGNVVYEIPQDSTSYSLNCGKGGTNEIYRLKIK